MSDLKSTLRCSFALLSFAILVTMVQPVFCQSNVKKAVKRDAD